MRTGIYTLLGILGIVLVVVMFMALGNVSDQIMESEAVKSESSLKSYVPIVSSVWHYGDSKNFIKLMVTEQVYESDKYTHIIVKGQEDDSGIKSYRESYEFEYTYKIDDDKITRKLLGNTLVDAFEEVVLLKKPLVKGNKWDDVWKNTNGDTFHVTCEIKDILSDGEVIIVESNASDGSFKILRTIEKDKGVTETRIFETFDAVEFEIGFQLLEFESLEYKGFDNYMAFLGNEKIGTTIDAIEEQDSVHAESNNKDSRSDESAQVLANGNENDQVLEDDEIELETKEAIIASVRLFNDKWIDFINDDDMTILQTIIPGSSVESIIQAYMDKEMTQKFLAMDFNRVVLKNNIANVYVYEEIERTMDGETEVLIYNWIYEVDYIDGQWLVEGYIENKSF